MIIGATEQKALSDSRMHVEAGHVLLDAFLPPADKTAAKLSRRIVAAVLLFDPASGQWGIATNAAGATRDAQRSEGVRFVQQGLERMKGGDRVSDYPLIVPVGFAGAMKGDK